MPVVLRDETTHLPVKVKSPWRIIEGEREAIPLQCNLTALIACVERRGYFGGGGTLAAIASVDFAGLVWELVTLEPNEPSLRVCKAPHDEAKLHW